MPRPRIADEFVNEPCRQRRAQLRHLRDGKCVCGKPLAGDGYKTCERCRKAGLKSQQRRHAAGLCTQCSQPHSSKMWLCDTCRDVAKAYKKAKYLERVMRGGC